MLIDTGRLGWNYAYLIIVTLPESMWLYEGVRLSKTQQQSQSLGVCG
jgi:hypothetical protein